MVIWPSPGIGHCDVWPWHWEHWWLGALWIILSWRVLVLVNFGSFSPGRFSHFHCSAMRKAIKVHKNLHTKQQNEHTLVSTWYPDINHICSILADWMIVTLWALLILLLAVVALAIYSASLRAELKRLKLGGELELERQPSVTNGRYLLPWQGSTAETKPLIADRATMYINWALQDCYQPPTKLRESYCFQSCLCVSHSVGDPHCTGPWPYPLLYRVPACTLSVHRAPLDLVPAPSTSVQGPGFLCTAPTSRQVQTCSKWNSLYSSHSPPPPPNMFKVVETHGVDKRSVVIPLEWFLVHVVNWFWTSKNVVDV